MSCGGSRCSAWDCGDDDLRSWPRGGARSVPLFDLSLLYYISSIAALELRDSNCMSRGAPRGRREGRRDAAQTGAGGRAGPPRRRRPRRRRSRTPPAGPAAACQQKRESGGTEGGGVK